MNVLRPHASPLRFGIFMPPMHKTGINPTLALHRDLAMIEHLDRLGFDDAWIGEHHSAGSELIASPEVFIAAASQRTTRIDARYRPDDAASPHGGGLRRDHAPLPR